MYNHLAQSSPRPQYSPQSHLTASSSPLFLRLLSMPSGRPRSNERWSLYPSLHDNVARLLEEDNLHFSFHETDDAESCIKDYDTNIMGRFKCHNSACNSDGWSSKR